MTYFSLQKVQLEIFAIISPRVGREERESESASHTEVFFVFVLWQNVEAVIRDLEEKVGHESQYKDPLDNLVISVLREDRVWLNG